MTKQVTLLLRADDAEPFLLKAAEEAAQYSAWCDYLTPKTYNAPSWGGMAFIDRKKEWQAKFLRAKRIVESFGVEYEPTSEPETLTVHYDYIGGTRKVLDLGRMGKVGMRTGSKPDYKHPRPAHASWHQEACRQAASRVVRKWKEMITA